MSLRTVTQVVPLQKLKMAATMPEVEIKFEREIALQFQLLLHIFSAMPDLAMTLSTLPDVGMLSKIKMAATETGNGNN